MTKTEFCVTYVLPALVAACTAVAGFLGMQIKALCQRYLDNRTKRDVVRTCVRAAEQLYHDLGGPVKLRKAQEGIQAMLREKNIAISDLELNAMIESVVSEFNYGLGVGRGGWLCEETEETP
ncbi:MAG: hypothetical protein IK141_04755 [Clostridia bacterium]|nr:hypothetical protein [Clostridia bacterium]